MKVTEPICSASTSSSSWPSSSTNSMKQVRKMLAISLMISIGIGLHNFGEGLAIGAAVLLGEVALSTFLIMGFMIHNTTEGFAIVTPLAGNGINNASGRKLMIRKIIQMGLIAGMPTIVGAWIGGFVYSPIAAVIFLSIGAGAIFQVVYSIISLMFNNDYGNLNNHSNDNVNSRKKAASRLLNTPTISGFIFGMLIMYLTSLLVPL